MGVAVFKQTTTFGKGNLIRRDSSRNVHRGGNDLKSKSRYVLPLGYRSHLNQLSQFLEFSTDTHPRSTFFYTLLSL